ncbi:MAG TPA: hypothetical protein VGI44_13540 [Acidimicrobiales bacterium]|jgi:hypothetical protein
MASEILAFDRHDRRSFPNETWRWIHTWRFSLLAPWASDRQILREMLDDEHYPYSFVTPYPETRKWGPKVRGPYYLDKLSPGSFSPITSEVAWDQLDGFLRDGIHPASRSDLDLNNLLGETIDTADALFQLQEYVTIRHDEPVAPADWGELVAIDRKSQLLLDIARGFD